MQLRSFGRVGRTQQLWLSRRSASTAAALPRSHDNGIELTLERFLGMALCYIREPWTCSGSPTHSSNGILGEFFELWLDKGVGVDELFLQQRCCRLAFLPELHDQLRRRRG